MPFPLARGFRFRSWPFATLLVCIVSLYVTAGYLGESGQDFYKNLTRWGWASADDLWSGKSLFGVVTNTFLHPDWIVFTWDVFWVGILGAIFEQNLGRKLWILFYLGACIVGMASSLAFDGDTGIGASGIFCAFFAFGWTARNRIAPFEKVLTKPLAAFFLLLLASQLAERAFHGTRISNAAHIWCLAYGYLCARALVLKTKPYVTFACLSVMLIGSVSVFLWCPWSTNWTWVTAKHAFDDHKYDKAEVLFKQSVDLGLDRSSVSEYLAWIYTIKGKRAEYAEVMEAYSQARPSRAKALASQVEEWKVRSASISQPICAGSLPIPIPATNQSPTEVR